MGKPMRFRHEHNIVEGMARDGREFGHLTENLRDSVLNGAANIEFGILLVPYPASDPDAEEYVGLRYVADDGSGMSDEVLTHIYGDFGVTGTTQDFDVELDDDGNVAVNVIPVDRTDAAHQRRGIGGRASMAVWNPAGLVVVTLTDGKPRVAWMFRTIEGPFQMREWSADAKPVMVVDPYVEAPYLGYDDVMVDKPYARALMIRSGLADSVEEADSFISEMEEDHGIPNPYAGMDWQSYIPKWVVSEWKDGKGYREDGTLAHGTVKILLGSQPGDSTAITGDPSFPNERQATRYEGAINNAWLDLSPWTVSVWSLSPVKPETKVGHRMFKMHGYDRLYRLNGGKGGAHELRGRPQVGALAQRTGARADVVLQKVLDLGKYGKALLLVTESAGRGKFPANRVDGIMCAVYGNELHGLTEANKLQAEGYQYRSMAIPGDSAFHKRVSLILFPPRAGDGVEGVFQAYARDNLKWSGMDRLPLGDKGGINEAVRAALKGVPEIFDLAHVDADESSYVVDKKRYRHLKEFMKSAIAGVAERRKRKTSGSGGTGGTEGVKGLVEDADGTMHGTEAEPHGKPTGERTPCPECGQKVHAADCPLKPKHSSSGGVGGRDGVLRKLTPDEKGALTGRPTRAKVAGPGAATEREPAKLEVDLKPPEVVPSDKPVESDDPEDSGRPGGMWPVVWQQPPTLGPETGTILVYTDHLAIQTLYAVARATGRNEKDAEANAWKWISRRLTDSLMGALELSEQRLDTATRTGKLGMEGMTELLATKEWWLPVVTAMLADTASLQSHVKATTPLAVAS